jgi:hypothetical protein
MDDSKAMNAWVARVFFNESGNNCLPSVVAVSVAKAEVEHSMVDAPNRFANTAQ